jgi:hypothetical protein
MQKVRVNFSLASSIKKQLSEIAKKNGLSEAEIIRRGILQQLKELGSL